MRGDLQALCQCSNGDKIPLGKSLDSEKSQILLNGQAMLLRGVLAEIQELAQFMAKGSQCLVIAFCHSIKISYYDISSRSFLPASESVSSVQKGSDLLCVKTEAPGANNVTEFQIWAPMVNLGL